MNKKIMPLLLLLVAAQLTTKAQMTVGGSYKPSHTLVVKGQVKIDTVKSGSIIDSLLTIGADSVLHRLPISSIVDGSQTRVTAGTNTTVTGTGTIATPYVINATVPATTNSLGVTGNTITSTVNGVASNATLIGTVGNTSSANTLTTTVNGKAGTAVNIINTNTLTNTNGALVSTVNGVASASVPVLTSASNGLTATNGNVVLGGTLTSATTITGAANKLSITSSATDGFAVDGTTFSVDAANHRVGFGTNAPATALDVRAGTAGTAFRMADGSQGAGKTLISDANGNATWNTINSNANAVIGSLSTNTSNNLLLSANNYTGTFITLPPGKWAVSVAMTIAIASSVPTIPSGSSIWVRSTLSASSTVIDTTNLLGNGKLVSGGATGPIDYGVVAGTFWVNNTSGANKTYYYWQLGGNTYSSVVTLNLLGLGNVNLLSGNSPTAVTTTRLNAFGTTAWGEDQIVATPIN